MTISLRKTMETAGLAMPATLSVRDELIGHVPVYATNANISLRKQLGFVASHFAIKSPVGAPGRGLWVEAIDTPSTNGDDDVKDKDFKILTSQVRFAALLDFAVGKAGVANSKGLAVNRLFLPLQPYRNANGDEPWIAARFNEAAARGVAVELVYAGNEAFGLEKAKDLTTEPSSFLTNDAFEYVVKHTLPKIAMASGGANPIAIQIDSEPWAYIDEKKQDPQRWWRYLWFIALVAGEVHKLGMHLTVAIVRQAALSDFPLDGPKAIINQKLNEKKLDPVTGSIAEWLFEVAKADRVIPMVYLPKAEDTLAWATKWAAVAKKPQSFAIGMHVGVSPDSQLPNVDQAFAAKLFASVELGKVDVTGAAGALTTMELRKLPTFAGLAIYRYEGYPPK